MNYARMKELDAQFNDEEITFEEWKAFVILNYPSYSKDKTIMEMLRKLYNHLKELKN